MKASDILSHRHADLHRHDHLRRDRGSIRVRQRKENERIAKVYLAACREATWTTRANTCFRAKMNRNVTAEKILACVGSIERTRG